MLSPTASVQVPGPTKSWTSPAYGSAPLPFSLPARVLGSFAGIAPLTTQARARPGGAGFPSPKPDTRKEGTALLLPLPVAPATMLSLERFVQFGVYSNPHRSGGGGRTEVGRHVERSFNASFRKA